MAVGIRPRVLHIRSSSALLGAEQVVLELLKNSAEFGVDAFLLVLRDPNDPTTQLYKVANDMGIGVTELECGGTPSRKVLSDLRLICESYSVSALHCHGYKEDILVWLAGISLPKVATNHLWKRTNLKLWIYSLLDALSLRTFQHVVAVSSKIQKDMNRLGVPASRTSLILNGIDVDSISKSEPDRERLISSLNIDKDTLLVASLSSLTPEKGIDVLVNAIDKVLRLPELQKLSFKVLVIGEGPERPRLEALIQDLGLEKTVVLLGHRSDARDLLKLVDIFVLPSRNEGLPISLLEAMASGCAVVATDVGEVKSVLSSSEQGALIQPDDSDMTAQAIGDFLTDSRKLESCKKQGYERVSHGFSAREMTRQYCDIYSNVLGIAGNLERKRPSY
ncbi:MULTISPECIES: glycosyltransferase family 4 protein [unclassified Marinobacter]|uniref:glycosyltransferase family 4 protein n=1 Tax=unclassified Marinobacter TaxID=83889 RepID=UPI00300A12C2